MGDTLTSKQLRDAMHRVADLAVDYLAGVEDRPVLPNVQPGDVARGLPETPPCEGEPVERILDDYQSQIAPALTHWQHPGFMAYFASSASGAGILGEALAATVNVNSMLWRSGPASVELEARVCDWLRQMIGLPEGFSGLISDTASMSTMIALAAARQRVLPEVRQQGLFGARRLILYTSDQAHSSVDKAAIALGLGLDAVRHIASDDRFRMKPEALAEVIRADLSAGHMPMAVVATAGTTSSSSIDPIAEIAEVCRRHELFLHVDAAYGGSAALVPELRGQFDGIEHADTVVVNPHKWMFVPIDCSVLWSRDPELLRQAFSLVPEYLVTGDGDVMNPMDYGVQLGRRLRALKLWMTIRNFGVEGLADRIREHCRLARWFAEQAEAEPGFEMAAPVPLGLVCFRALPEDLSVSDRQNPEATDRFNLRLMAEVNATGPVFISHTALAGRMVLRLAVGNLRTEQRHVEAAWSLIRETAALLRDQMRDQMRDPTGRGSAEERTS